jgi:ATP-binding cassette subfamily B protein
MSTNVQSALASCKRFFDFLDAKNEEEDKATKHFGEDGKKFEGKVAFENVYFSYLPEDPLIEDLNFAASPGQMIAIVGPTGAGKTTIVNLLMRFYEIQKGEIKVSGINTKNVSRQELRSHFGMVLQDTWLFRGTIKDNLLYGLKPGKEISEEEFMEACKKTHVDDFVSSLKNGYQTMLDSDASQLSQGEKQLLTICRAYISQPDILILDEATSSVDTRTEMLVQQAMNSLSQNRTSFVIAHRLSTIRDADTILVVNHGNIVEKGNHEELLKKNGEYAKLYRSQFAD